MQDFSTKEMAGTPCSVCGDTLPEVHHTLCETCGSAFHFRMMENVQAKDCGQVYMDEQACTTLFICNPCYMTQVYGEQQTAGG